MENKELIEFKNEFYRLVNFTNERDGLPNFYKLNIKSDVLLNGREYEQKIEYIFRKLKKYCIDNGIAVPNEFPFQRIYIICQNEFEQQQIYEICSSSGYLGKHFGIKKNLDDVDFPIINFKNVIKYYYEKNQIKELEELKMIIIELKNQGLSSDEIENYIKNILSNENENNKKRK